MIVQTTGPLSFDEGMAGTLRFLMPAQAAINNWMAVGAARATSNSAIHEETHSHHWT